MAAARWSSRRRRRAATLSRAGLAQLALNLTTRYSAR
jgi:hypothetical protein